MNIQDLIDRIEKDYNAEQDVPGPYSHPLVTITDLRLLMIIEKLLERIKRIENFLDDNYRA